MLHGILKTYLNLPLKCNLAEQMEKPLRKKRKPQGISASQVVVLYCWSLYSPLKINQPLDSMLHLIYCFVNHGQEYADT